MSLLRLAALIPVLSLIVSAQETPAAPKPETQAQSQRGGARLGSAAQRNENVAVQEIDTNVTKELNVRVGDNVSLVSEMPVEANYYAAEHGQTPAESLHLRPSARQADWHADLTESLQNSVFNARTFFQVGPVKPSHRNLYGGRASGRLPWLGRVSLTANQRKIRGMVNGKRARAAGLRAHLPGCRSQGAGGSRALDAGVSARSPQPARFRPARAQHQFAAANRFERRLHARRALRGQGTPGALPFPVAPHPARFRACRRPESGQPDPHPSYRPHLRPPAVERRHDLRLPWFPEG